MTARVAGITKAAATMITGSMTFKSLGIDSLMAIQLRNQLEACFNLKLSVTTFWARPTLKEYSEYLYGELSQQYEAAPGGNSESEVEKTPLQKTKSDFTVK